MAKGAKALLQVCTARELALVNAYLSMPEPNAQEAARIAGYSTKSKDAGWQVLRRPHVQAEIKRQRDARSESAGVSTEHVLQHLKEIAFLDIGELVDDNNKLLPIKQLPERVRRVMSHLDLVVHDGVIIGVKPMPASKIKGVQMLLQHLGMLEKDDGKKGATVALHLDFNFSAPVGAPTATINGDHSMVIDIPSGGK